MTGGIICPSGHMLGVTIRKRVVCQEKIDVLKMHYNKSWFRLTILPLSTIAGYVFLLGNNIHVDPVDQMAAYNELPIANVICFTYRYFYHLSEEIIVKLYIPKLYC